MYRRLVLCVAFVWLGLSSEAQETRYYVLNGDTLQYTYTPLVTPQDSVAKVQPRKRNFLMRVADYYARANEDRTFQKKIDFTFVGGLGYSKNTNLSFAAMAVGQYRVDRTDSVTSPSNITMFGNVSVTGVYAVGVSGRTYFSGDRHRLNYTVDFLSAPRSMWGVGYDAGRYNAESEYVEKTYRIEATYLRKVLKATYLGVLFDFQHTDGQQFDDESYLRGQKRKYTSTGVGLVAEYDSRDVATAPQKGLYLSLRETFFPKGLGTVEESLWRTHFTANYYQKMWTGGVLAFDLHGEFNSDGTPWVMLARMGGSFRMRGYYEGRYTDNDLVTFQVELRQKIWRRIGGVVWGGAGNVFPRLKDFDWNKTLYNYGVGLRWEMKKQVNVRLDYGFGKHTSGFMLNINEAF